MSKVIQRSGYTFTPGSKTLDLSGVPNYSSAPSPTLLAVINQNTETTVYQIGKTGFGGTFAGSVLTFEASASGMAGADKLIIIFDDGAGEHGDLVAIATALATLHTDLTTLLAGDSGLSSGLSQIHTDLGSLLTSIAQLHTDQTSVIASLASILTDENGIAPAVGAPGDAAASADTGSFSIIALLKRGLARWTTLLTLLPASLGQKAMAGSLPVTLPSDQTVAVDTVVKVTATDRSGTIATGGTAQQLMVANASRRGFEIQNLSSGDLWISGLTTAVLSQPSMRIRSGGYYESPPHRSGTGAISIIGATTGQAFFAREF